MPQRVNRRLRALTAQLAAAAVEELPEAGSGPGGQGFGPRATESPPHFACDELEAAIAFFEEMGYVCFKEALTEAQLAHINDFCDRTQRDDPVGWQIPTDGSPWTGARYSQPLLDTEELDYCVKLDSIFPFVTAIFGEGNERFSEFNLRDTPGGAGSLKMGFHHDAALGQRTTRKPYHPCDWLCSICCKCSTRSMPPFCQRVSTLLLSTDLTDVSPDEPAFAVVPRTVRHEPIGRAKVELGADYIEQPLWGPAGTCIFCASSNNCPPQVLSQIGLS